MNQRIAGLLNNEGGNYIFPFFWQHGETEEVLREYMKVIDESNIKAVCVESRPHPDFCGEKWWQDMDVILDEARNRGMKVWILDDSHFPTGFANGAMTDQSDEFCRQSICCRIRDVESGDVVYIGSDELLHPDPFQKTMIENYMMEKEPRIFDDDRLLGLWAVRLDDEKDGFRLENADARMDLLPLVKDGRLEWTAPAGKWKIYMLHLSRNHGYHRSYINMLDKASCRVLIDAVYEPHYTHYKEDFGSTVAGFFSDEPELGNGHLYDMDDPFGSPLDYPWSRELEETLRIRLGADYTLMMALLWETGADSMVTAKARYAFMDAVTELVKKDFSEQIGSWCREHNVQYIGHLIEDNNHHTRTQSSLGHYFRGLWGQDMAGIDDIGGQVFPQGEDVSYNRGLFQCRNGEFYHYMLGKLASSAAAIEPGKKGNSMCEIFGNYGWSEGVRLEKYLADHFLVRGINHYVPHAFSPKEFPDPDCPPHFYAHGHNPQYRHFGYLMAYMNRVCELISNGYHIAPAAVIYHAEGDWTGKHLTSDRIGHILADSHIEYDYIPQDAFAQRDAFYTQMEDGTLRINKNKYSVVIVPYMQYITTALAEAVAEMTACGIPVLFAGGLPDGLCDTPVSGSEAEENRQTDTVKDHSVSVDLEDLAEYLKGKQISELSIEPENNRIRYIHYMHNDGCSVWMFVNEGAETYRGTVHLKEDVGESCIVYGYDAWENCIRPADYEDGAIRLEIEPLKSYIFIADPHTSAEEIRKLQKPEHQKEEEVRLNPRWKRSICRSKEYPHLREEKEITLPDHLAEEAPLFSGFVRYENVLNASSDDRMLLEISDAYEGVEVFVNDQSLGIQIVPTYQFDLTGTLKDGENTIRIEVATTLEREMSQIPDFTGNTQEPQGLSGITGTVKVFRCRDINK